MTPLLARAAGLGCIGDRPVQQFHGGRAQHRPGAGMRLGRERDHEVDAFIIHFLQHMRLVAFELDPDLPQDGQHEGVTIAFMKACGIHIDLPTIAGAAQGLGHGRAHRVERADEQDGLQ